MDKHHIGRCYIVVNLGGVADPYMKGAIPRMHVGAFADLSGFSEEELQEKERRFTKMYDQFTSTTEVLYAFDAIYGVPLEDIDVQRERWSSHDQRLRERR